jgi:surface antigen
LAAAVCRAAPAVAGNCVLYARAETGVALFGAAGGWWNQAQGRYQRGQKPAVGAILVFERTGHMPSGHVAVVSAILGPREILVDQSNWFHGATTHGDQVIDTSADNDWTSVMVGRGVRDNPTFGFIYPQTAPDGLDTYVGETRNAAAGLVRLAVARDVPFEASSRTHHAWRHHAARGESRAKRAAARAAHHHPAPRHAAVHHTAPHRTARHEPSRHERHRHA